MGKLVEGRLVVRSQDRELPAVGKAHVVAGCVMRPRSCGLRPSVERRVATVFDHCSGRRNQFFSRCKVGSDFFGRLLAYLESSDGIAFDLIGVEHAEGPHHSKLPFVFVARLVVHDGLFEGLIEDDLRSPSAGLDVFRSLLDPASERLPLLEAGPEPRREAVLQGVHFQNDRVDAGVGVAAGRVGVATTGSVQRPRSPPRHDSSFQGGDNLGSDFSSDLDGCGHRVTVGIRPGKRTPKTLRAKRPEQHLVGSTTTPASQMPTVGRIY